jgi:ornithine--oxo-acid transaminase
MNLKKLTPELLGNGIKLTDPLYDMVKCPTYDKTTSPYKNYINSTTFCQSTKNIILKERDYVCFNYAPLPIVLNEGNGCLVKDISGKIYIDFLSAYSALNFGHNNRSIINAAKSQMDKLFLTSRAFYNNNLCDAAEKITKFFRYDKVLFMNGGMNKNNILGVEAVESALKIARKWAYKEKKIPIDQARTVFFSGNFHGRTISVCGNVSLFTFSWIG